MIIVSGIFLDLGLLEAPGIPGPEILAVERGVSSDTIKWYGSSSAADFDSSEIAGPVSTPKALLSPSLIECSRVCQVVRAVKGLCLLYPGKYKVPQGFRQD